MRNIAIIISLFLMSEFLYASKVTSHQKDFYKLMKEVNQVRSYNLSCKKSKKKKKVMNNKFNKKKK